MQNYSQQITGFSWRGDMLEQLSPYARLINLQSNEVNYADLTLPYVFNWELSSEFYCPGYRDGNGKYIKCPKHTIIDAGYDQCAECSKQSGFKQAFFFGAEPNERMEKHLSKQHYIYLAYFPVDKIKVGTVVNTRKYKRLIEQDALYSKIIASAPGTKISDLENKISKFLGASQSMRKSHKYNNLKRMIDVNRAEQSLSAAVQKLKNSTAAPQITNHLVPAAELETVNLIDHQHIYYPPAHSDLVKLKKFDVVAGIFLGLRANWLLVKHQEQIYVLDTTFLVNRKLKYIDGKPLEYKIDGAAQQRLF